MAKHATPGLWTVRRLAWALGAGATLAVLLTLGDPGITIDEPLDVRPGRTYVATLRARGWGFFERATVARVFADNAEHPPLGRWLLGVASTLGEPFEPWLGGADPFGVHAGRLAPALCFGALVGLIAAEAGRRYGRAAALAAGGSLVLMPRVFAHAHLAALDTFLCLFWTAALLAAARAVESRRPVAAMMAAGAAWGLALLTKIHAWLLPPIVLLYALRRLRVPRAAAALATWGAVGFLVYFAGWPWLWYDTVGRLTRYLNTGVGRLALRVEYFGRVYLDRDVPWHYPWLYFAATVPVGLHALGVAGLVRGWRGRREDPFPILMAGVAVGFLALFSTRVAVYDGERLFLVAFPAWAMLIGLGTSWAWGALAGRTWARAALVGAVLCQGYGTVALHPFGLSYYNALVGGLPGAERLGLELTYWADAVDGVLLDRLAREARPGELAALAPTLHHVQATATLTPELVARQVRLADESAAGRAAWLVVYRRTAYWPDAVRRLVAAGRPVIVRARQGVWLSALLPTPDHPPDARNAAGSD